MRDAAIQQISMEEEYKKEHGIIPADIQNLRDWVRTQPHLPAEHITDLDLVLAYNSSSRSAEVSKQLLDLHLTLKTLLTSYFQHRTFDSSLEVALDHVLITPLPTRTKEGYAVLYACFMNKDYKSFNLTDVVKLVTMVLDVWQYEEGSWPGFVIVFDLNNMSLGHLTRFDLQNLQHYLYYLQHGLMANLRGVHYLNAPPFMSRFLLLIKPFLRNSLLDVLYTHAAGSDTIQEYYPIEALPAESGGKYKSVGELSDDMVSKLRASQQFFLEESKKRVTESKRNGKQTSITDIFGGVEGSFKKLEVD